MLLPSTALSKTGGLCPGSATGKNRLGNGNEGYHGRSVRKRARESWWKAVGGAFVMGSMRLLA